MDYRAAAPAASPLSTAHAGAPAPASSGDFDRLMSKAFTPRDIIEDNNFEKLWRMATALADSALSLPKELKGNVGDCMAIVTQAMIWGLNPFAVAQKVHVINGKLGYEAQLVNAVVMQSGAIRGSFHYEFRGDGAALECRVGAVLAGESEVTWGEFLRMSDITTKNSPLWKTNPRQQMGYLQVKNWARAYCPGAILGIYTDDELADYAGSERMTPTSFAAAVVTAPALPPYSDVDFEINLPKWQKLIDAGKKTPSELLATLRTRATFSEAQQARVLSLRASAQAKSPPDASAQAQQQEAIDDRVPQRAHDDWAAAYDAAEGGAQ